MGQREIVISWCGHIPVFDQCKMEMPVETFLYFGYIFHLGDAANTDLLPLVNIGHWFTHFH
jgi:hypothetical protein